MSDNYYSNIRAEIADAILNNKSYIFLQKM